MLATLPGMTSVPWRGIHMSLKEQDRTVTLASGGELMLKAAIKVGPADQGRPMGLADFDHAKVQDGYLYELGRGTIVASDVPKKRHLNQVLEYWILDADKQEMLILQRVGGRWRERIVRPPEIYQTRILPGLQFSCEFVFQAANAAGN